MKTKVYWKGEVSSAHKLKLPYKSKCTNLHGHNWLVEIWVEGEVNEEGMVMDFTEIKDTVMLLDHSYLNDIIDQPTSENIAYYIANELKLKRKNTKIKVRIWEDKDSYAEVEL